MAAETLVGLLAAVPPANPSDDTPWRFFRDNLAHADSPMKSLALIFFNRDIAALVASAERTRPIWPDEPPLPEVDLIASHGSRAGSALVALLATEPDGPSGTNLRNVHVEQRAALALCKIYRVLPTAGETVRDVRSTPQDDSQVSGFWRRKV